VSNLLAEISAVVKPDYSNIMALGYLGARLEDYVGPNGKYSKTFARELTWGKSAVLLGHTDQRRRQRCRRLGTLPERQVRIRDDHLGCIDQTMLDAKMVDLGGWLLAMVGEVHDAYEAAHLRRPDIFIHCYAYAPPNGKGFEAPLFRIPLTKAWLKPAMDKRSVPPDYELRKEIVRRLIDRLAETFKEFGSRRDRVYVIESQKALDPDVDWDNELHPNGEGFRKLVHGPWLEVLQKTRYAV
jgi:hypothetical protein